MVALAAGGNLDELAGQIERYRPELVSVATPGRRMSLLPRCAKRESAKLPAIHHGREGMLAVGTHGQRTLWFRRRWAWWDWKRRTKR